MDAANPLNEAHFQQIQDALAKLAIAQQHLDMAIRAGIETGDAQQRIRDGQDRLLRIKQVYFPGR